MRLSKTVLKADIAKQKILEFAPRKFELQTPAPALEYLERKKSSNFRMNDAIRVQTGVEQIEASGIEEQIENRVLERLQDVQETAYREAYQLGLDEGRKEAFKKAAEEIDQRLAAFETLIQSITSMKKDLLQFNETHLVKLLFHMASRLAHAEITANPDLVIEVLRKAVEHAQIEEEIKVQVNPNQLAFWEKLKTETQREFEFVKKVNFVPIEGISEGGCVLQTNYGEIDARFEERVGKLWETLAENLYHVKDKVSVA
jgi:flagellar assembly protein FliH